MSESSNGLQKSLDILKSYCDKWNLEVNINKTMIMIFNKSGRILKNVPLFYDNQVSSHVNQYKYLGIILKPSGSFNEAINNLSKKKQERQCFVFVRLFMLGNYDFSAR